MCLEPFYTTPMKLSIYIQFSVLHLHVDDEGMSDLLQDVFFTLYMFNLFQSDDITDRQDLHCVVLVGGFLPAQANTTECSGTCNRQYIIYNICTF